MKKKLTSVGIVELVSGVLSSVLIIWTLTSPGALPFFKSQPVPASFFFVVLLACASLPIAGGIAALRGKAWGLSLAGALFSSALLLGAVVLRQLVNARDDWPNTKGEWMLRILTVAYLVIFAVSFTGVLMIDTEVFHQTLL